MIFEKKGFTLVELLVVMSIIGILAAALVVSMPKVSERARDMKCKANLKNLAQASLAYSIQHEHFPRAYPGEDINASVNSRTGVMYYEDRGWVNWTGNGEWPNADSQKSKMTLPKLTGDLAFESLTNGVVWSFAGKEASTFCCPAFAKAARVQGLTDIWRSYVMNYLFHWHGTSVGFNEHQDFTNDQDGVQRSAETVLMFAELPMDDIDTSEEGGDGKLDPDNDDEYIGFNHRVGKRNISHVVYADGHVGVLLEPSSKSQTDLRELTTQLCWGKEIDRALLREMH